MEVHANPNHPISTQPTPNFNTPTLKALKDAIPPTYFQPSTTTSLAYLSRDITYATILLYTASFIDHLPTPPLRLLAWTTYGFLQGCIFVGLWILAHECGHGAFSPYTWLNDLIGWILHSTLLVPYFSWKITHARHHRYTNHMGKDTAFVPYTEAEYKTRLMATAELVEDTPVMNLVTLIGHQVFGWPMYLFTGVTAGKNSLPSGVVGGGNMNHFDPLSGLFTPSQRVYVLLSDAGLGAMGYFLVSLSRSIGMEKVMLLYFVPQSHKSQRSKRQPFPSSAQPANQVGRSILLTLLTTIVHQVIQLVHPASESKAESINITAEQRKKLQTAPVDILAASTDDLASILSDVEVVVSALNGVALNAQGKVQDAAEKAGIRRFYLSEFGFHHTYYGENEVGYLHPTWAMKEEANEKTLHHPAIASGKMTYTLIGCGDFYNQDREVSWCPWTQPNLPSYRVHIVGNADAKIDFTHIDDLAAFLVKTIEHPGLSENKELNFLSDHISYNEMATLLEKYSSRKVERNILPIEVMHCAWKNKDEIPEDVKGKSPFPDDFWILVKGMQGLDV
ncbi:hypothetical protein BBP40_011469 [Aspergillus hancockii]|nr:hypothetical protein BBP40_011469 [Aspergillus hancockii]